MQGRIRSQTPCRCPCKWEISHVSFDIALLCAIQKKMAVESGRHTRSFSVSLLLTVIVVTLVIESTSAATTTNQRSLSKRSFFDINCKGTYDARIYARLEIICQDCYNLYREPELLSLCTAECFNTPFFGGCVKALLMEEMEDELRKMKTKIG